MERRPAIHCASHPIGSAPDPDATETADPADVAALIAGFCSQQQGLVSRQQLLRSGVPPHHIDGRLRNGRFTAVHPGVYRVGPLMGPRASEMAAVLACGAPASGIAVSHGSAGRMQRLISTAATPVELSVTRVAAVRRPGLLVHRVRSLPDDEVARIDGIPVTGPARTLLDLAACLGRQELDRAFARADRADPGLRIRLVELLARYPRRPGTPAIARLVHADPPPPFTRSIAEERVFEMIVRAGFPRPRVNSSLLGLEPDFLWPAQRLILEIDGFHWHGSRTAFERDHDRDGILTAAGYRVMRITWKQIVERPERVIARIAQALTASQDAAH